MAIVQSDRGSISYSVLGACLFNLLVFTAVDAVAQDMARTTEEHVRNATVMVITEVPGSDQGGTGTGAFINRNGLVVTNNHVVDPNHGKSVEERAKNFRKITTPKYSVIIDSGTDDERRMPATLLHQTESGDLALLQVKDEDGQPLQSADYLTFIIQEDLKEDAKVWVFGFPGGRQRGKDVAITSGLVTELTRTPSGAVTYVETDATVNPGNSGGPVVDVAGRFFGVATHKRFGNRSKDLSGAVPAPLVQQFILGGFGEGRVPKATDVLPFMEIFTNYNGVVNYPNYERDAEDVIVYRKDGTIRHGELKTKAMTLDTVLGKLEIPLERAAYMLLGSEEANMIMDGGDRLSFDPTDLSVSIAFAGRAKKVSFSDVEAVAFAKPKSAIQYPVGSGVILEANKARLGLGDIQDKVAIGGGSYELSDLTGIELSGTGKRLVRTVRGERLEAKLNRANVRAVTAWSDGELKLSLSALERAGIRRLEWAFVNARGRRLADQLNMQDEDLIEIAGLLEGSDWAKASDLLDKAAQTKRRNRDGKQQLKLLGALVDLRAGSFEAAETALGKLGRKKDNVGRLAQGYAEILADHPDGQFMGAPLSEPDAIWRASSAAAYAVLADIDERMAKLEKMPYRKKAKELEALEREIDTANRLELGIAQGKLMKLLEIAYFAHIAGYEEMQGQYNEAVAEHNRQRNRTQQTKFRRKIKSLEGKLKNTRKEVERLYERLVTESTGFTIEPPKLGE